MRTDKFFHYSVGWKLVPVGSSPEMLAGDEGYQGRLLMTSGGSDSPDKRTVEVERRRHAEPPPSGGRKRAETPQRQESGSGGGGSGGGTGSSSGLPFPKGKGPTSIIGMILMLVVLCIFFAIQYFGGNNSTDQTSYVEPTVQEYMNEDAYPIAQSNETLQEPTALPEPTAVPVQSNLSQPTAKPTKSGTTTKNDQTWLVMLYQDADDKVLEQDIYVDLNEAERAGSTDRVKIVAQMDRFAGAYSGDGNWTSTKRFLITQDDDLSRVRSQQIADLGEANMSDSKTLIDFVTWAMKAYPADKYVLILSDHGMGWPGGWSDASPASRGDPRIPLASRLGGELYLNQIDAALTQIRSQTGLEKFELIGMDACLMAQLEVFTALEPHARYAVASEEVEPALGWAYTGVLQALTQNPDMDGEELSQTIVESYINGDQRIVDRNARAELLRQSSPLGSYGNVTAAQLANQIGQSSTLTAVNLENLPGLIDRFNQLSFVLQSTRQQAIAHARTYAQSFTSIFGNQVPPSYIDLGSFLQLLIENTSDTKVTKAANDVLAAIQQTVISEKHGPKKPGATGITIYFPNSQLYQSAVSGAESYTAIANRFAEQSLWDDFLAYHYTGEKFDKNATVPVTPSSGTAMRAPGAGQITISEITASGKTAAPGKPVTLSADVSGDNIGYIYLFTGFYDQASNSIFVADRDYLQSADTREVNGVYYPDWGEGDFTLKFKWEPLVFAINDGVDSVTALFTPRSYGETFEQAIYTVDGTYTFADSGEQQAARLYFSNGQLQQVYGFTEQDWTGAPHEITPVTGDTITILETWLDLDQNGNISQTATQLGGTLTFGDRLFKWEELDAAAGQYVVGFVVEDLDGNSTESFTQITVR
jgi:hypothetical protein